MRLLRVGHVRRTPKNRGCATNVVSILITHTFSLSSPKLAYLSSFSRDHVHTHTRHRPLQLFFCFFFHSVVRDETREREREPRLALLYQSGLTGLHTFTSALGRKNRKYSLHCVKVANPVRSFDLVRESETIITILKPNLQS